MLVTVMTMMTVTMVMGIRCNGDDDEAVLVTIMTIMMVTMVIATMVMTMMMVNMLWSGP